MGWFTGLESRIEYLEKLTKKLSCKHDFKFQFRLIPAYYTAAHKASWAVTCGDCNEPLSFPETLKKINEVVKE